MSVLLPAYNTKSILVLFGARFMIIFSMNNNRVFLQLGAFFLSYVFVENLLQHTYNLLHFFAQRHEHFQTNLNS